MIQLVLKVCPFYRGYLVDASCFIVMQMPRGTCNIVLDKYNCTPLVKWVKTPAMGSSLELFSNERFSWGHERLGSRVTP